MLKTKLFNAGLIITSLLYTSVMTVNNDELLNPGDKIAFMQNLLDTAGEIKTDSFTINNHPENQPAIQLNKNVEKFVKDYIRKNGFFIGKSKNKIDPYFTIIDSVFEDMGLPVELKYLAYIESGLKRNISSRSGAAGPWAFMPVAAKQYGLKISKAQDERLDYNKSTRAAASLLCDLFAKYNDWLLVVAAYNCGPGYIQKAIKISGSHNYWALQNFLPEETRKHVKKFIAVHYYFEGKAGLVTMTKAETENYNRIVYK
jgi:membrane-bound lytic murein transglycosylase D